MGKTENEIKALKAETEKDGFWNDVEKATSISKKISILENKIKKYTDIKENFDFLKNLSNEILSEDDELYLEFLNSLNALEKNAEEFKISLMLNEKFDELNAIVTIQAGAGGTEAQDWAAMLFRMYSMYCEKNKFKVSVLNTDVGDEAGLKSVSFKVAGDFAYGYLKCEKGVHRLVRISPFDANKRRHTSFASVDVVPEILEAPKVEINKNDLKIDTYCSSGAGGQHVNKTESACRITHIPTGIVVTCQNERSLIQNKEQAMKILYSKLMVLEEEKQKDLKKQVQGELKKIEWGSQIRSYVFCPYTMVKDHRTGFETSNVAAVMDGEIEGFIADFLIKSKS